jgi:hypothetical protein
MKDQNEQAFFFTAQMSSFLRKVDNAVATVLLLLPHRQPSCEEAANVRHPCVITDQLIHNKEDLLCPSHQHIQVSMWKR